MQLNNLDSYWICLQGTSLKDTSEIRSLGYSGHLTEFKRYINTLHRTIILFARVSVLERFHCIHKKTK